MMTSSNEALSIHFYMQRNDPLIICSIWAPQSEHMVEKRQRFYSVRKDRSPQLFKHFRDHSLPPSCPIDRPAWIQRSKFTWISSWVHHTENTSLNPDYCSSHSDPESEKQALPSEWEGHILSRLSITAKSASRGPLWAPGCGRGASWSTRLKCWCWMTSHNFLEWQLSYF